MAKKTFNEKLYGSKDLPKVDGNMLIAAPTQYNEIMKLIPEGKLITSDEIRTYLAQKHNADFTCQLTAGIFINIAANASQERENSGCSDITPYWRTLKKGGELNEKYPGGIEKQKALLQTEGHEIIKKGKRYFVKDYEKKIHKIH